MQGNFSSVVPWSENDTFKLHVWYHINEGEERWVTLNLAVGEVSGNYQRFTVTVDSSASNGDLIADGAQCQIDTRYNDTLRIYANSGREDQVDGTSNNITWEFDSITTESVQYEQSTQLNMTPYGINITLSDGLEGTSKYVDLFGDFTEGCVKYNEAQSLETSQINQARDNLELPYEVVSEEETEVSLGTGAGSVGAVDQTSYTISGTFNLSSFEVDKENIRVKISANDSTEIAYCKCMSVNNDTWELAITSIDGYEYGAFEDAQVIEVTSSAITFIYQGVSDNIFAGSTLSGEITEMTTVTNHYIYNNLPTNLLDLESESTKVVTTYTAQNINGVKDFKSGLKAASVQIPYDGLTNPGTLQIEHDKVTYTPNVGTASSATWTDIIDAANSGGGGGGTQLYAHYIRTGTYRVCASLITSSSTAFTAATLAAYLYNNGLNGSSKLIPASGLYYNNQISYVAYGMNSANGTDLIVSLRDLENTSTLEQQIASITDTVVAL